jgi:hypothetical protein
MGAATVAAELRRVTVAGAAGTGLFCCCHRKFSFRFAAKAWVQEIRTSAFVCFYQ